MKKEQISNQYVIWSGKYNHQEFKPKALIIWKGDSLL